MSCTVRAAWPCAVEVATPKQSRNAKVSSAFHFSFRQAHRFYTSSVYRSCIEHHSEQTGFPASFGRFEKFSTLLNGIRDESQLLEQLRQRGACFASRESASELSRSAQCSERTVVLVRFSTRRIDL